jgi:heme oxygenase
MRSTMIETRAMSLPQRLKTATTEEHRRVERSGVMVTLLRGRIERVAYLALLRNLHALYAALEPALLRHAASAVVGPVVMPELFRSDALERDLQTLHRDADPPAAALQPATAAYVARLRELDATRPELLVAHAYVRYLGDLSGGQQLRRIVGQALGLAGGAGTRFYDFGDGARVSALAQRFRAALEEVGARAHDADAIVAEAESAFDRHGQLFEQLAAAA